MQNLTIHPELMALQPPHSQSRAKQLKEGILRVGCLTPILVWKHTIIDGHRRYAICKKHKIPFKTIEANFKSIDDAKLWIYETLLDPKRIFARPNGQPISENSLGKVLRATRERCGFRLSESHAVN